MRFPTGNLCKSSKTGLCGQPYLAVLFLTICSDKKHRW